MAYAADWGSSGNVVMSGSTRPNRTKPRSLPNLAMPARTGRNTAVAGLKPGVRQDAPSDVDGGCFTQLKNGYQGVWAAYRAEMSGEFHDLGSNGNICQETL